MKARFRTPTILSSLFLLFFSGVTITGVSVVQGADKKLPPCYNVPADTFKDGVAQCEFIPPPTKGSTSAGLMVSPEPPYYAQLCDDFACIALNVPQDGSLGGIPLDNVDKYIGTILKQAPNRVAWNLAPKACVTFWYGRFWRENDAVASERPSLGGGKYVKRGSGSMRQEIHSAGGEKILVGACPF